MSMCSLMLNGPGLSDQLLPNNVMDFVGRHRAIKTPRGYESTCAQNVFKVIPRIDRQSAANRALPRAQERTGVAGRKEDVHSTVDKSMVGTRATDPFNASSRSNQGEYKTN